MDSRSWKASCALQDGFPELESFLHAAGRIPAAGKFPAHCRTDSSRWKKWPTTVADFPEAGNIYFLNFI